MSFFIEQVTSPRRLQRGDYVELFLRSGTSLIRGWLDAVGQTTFSVRTPAGRLHQLSREKHYTAVLENPPCHWCWGEREDHVNDQCLFQSTRYQPGTAKDAVARKNARELAEVSAGW